MIIKKENDDGNLVKTKFNLKLRSEMSWEVRFENWKLRRERWPTVWYVCVLGSGPSFFVFEIVFLKKRKREDFSRKLREDIIMVT